MSEKEKEELFETLVAIMKTAERFYCDEDETIVSLGEAVCEAMAKREGEQ